MKKFILFICITFIGVIALFESYIYPTLRVAVALFYRIIGQSHQVVANAYINMYFDCDGNGINAKNGTCKDLG